MNLKKDSNDLVNFSDMIIVLRITERMNLLFIYYYWIKDFLEIIE